MQKWGNFTDVSDNEVHVYVSEKLNERYYGELQGLNKEETKKNMAKNRFICGEEVMMLLRPEEKSLKDVCKRIIPFYKKYIEKDLKDGKNVLVVASHNSLRAIVKYVENISDEKIIDLELPFGALVKYDFDGKNYSKLA